MRHVEKRTKFHFKMQQSGVGAQKEHMDHHRLGETSKVTKVLHFAVHMLEFSCDVLKKK